MEYADVPITAFGFNTDSGDQIAWHKDNKMYALALRKGDVAVVPEPAVMVFLMLGLGSVMAMRPKRWR